MDAASLSPLLDQLEVQIDDLRDVLEPLLATALSHYAAKLPLLDKAKLYVLVTYAIESLLFCMCGGPPRVIYTILISDSTRSHS
jgi:exosome complex protein LRP1